MGRFFERTDDTGKITTFWFDYPGEKVNKISPDVLDELEAMLKELALENPKALLIRSRKEDIFIAGADLKTFQEAFHNIQLAEKLIDKGHAVFRYMESLPFPTIAVIDGVCLGGGTEFILSCTYRVATDNPKVQIGLPEVNLGIFPGWGGTQRLPRLIGLEQGVMMIVTGKPVDSKKALKLHLVDKVVSKEFLEDALHAFVDKILSKNGAEEVLSYRRTVSFRNFLLEKNPLGRSFLFNRFKKGIDEKTKGFYPAPLIAADLIERTASMSKDEGLNEEVKTFKTLLHSHTEIPKNLIDLFFIQEEIKKNPGLTSKAAPMPIKKAGLIGAGTMGGGIAFILSQKDIPVRFKEINQEALGKGYGHVFSLYQKEIKRKKIPKEIADRKFQLVSGTLNYDGFKQADIVLEAALENIDVKKQVYKELEEIIRDDALIATNTSTITIKNLSEGMKHPERLIGMHFFNPPEKMPLVEIIQGEKTSPVAVETAAALCKKLGKMGLVVKDCPGFLVNRIFAAGANEAGYLLEEGVPMHDIESEIVSFGMPMGPFTLADEVGNDVAYKAFTVIENAYPPRMKQPIITKLMDENKLWGKKSGQGYFLYDNGTKKRENPKIALLLKGAKSRRSPKEGEIKERFLLSMINEAARCLEEKIVPSPKHIDIALLYGMGFPAFRGGLLKYADTIGAKKIVERLKSYESEFGVRFNPCALLTEMAESGKTFY